MAKQQGYPSQLVASSSAPLQSFAASPRPASGSSRKGNSTPSAHSTPDENDSETRQVSTAASSNEAIEAWAAPRKPPPSADPSPEWQEAIENLQREYAEAVRSIDSRVAQRMTQLRSQLESFQQHELPPSYPPSDVAPDTEPELVETDPELISN
ncbi:Hypothetical protein SCF082_LOCUS29217 [Durusdinium trenchii]|uniref:Uncharacterized protein n=1 Tax=Durusdinium trenchii TaxID=1381693 RepID=A0ABP0MRE6_9DINO|eukprot:g2309.t1